MIAAGAQTLPLKIVGGTTFSRYPKISAETTVNLMVTSTGEALVPYLGHRQRIKFPLGAARGSFLSTNTNKLIEVIGQYVFVTDTNFQYFIAGTLDTNTGPVYLAENQANQIAIVDGAFVYIWNYSTNIFTKDTSGDTIPSPDYIQFQDTYFIISSSLSNQWQLSKPNNGLIFDPLLTQRMQSDADKLQCIAVLERQLWIIGKKQGEMWRDAGLSTFPYQRDNTTLLNYGILSPRTLTIGFGKIVFLAINQSSQITLVYSDGSSGKEFSNDGLSYLLNSLTQPSNSTATLFQSDGHIIYQITFIADNLTIAYDFSNGLFYNVTDEDGNYHPAFRSNQFNSKLYFNSLRDSGLYEWSTAIYNYDGAVIPRKRVVSPLRSQDNKRRIILRAGIGIENGENNPPGEVDLSLAQDGNELYGTVDTYPMNQVGYRNSMIDWYQLGMCNDLSLQFSFWSEGRFVILNGTMDWRVSN